MSLFNPRDLMTALDGMPETHSALLHTLNDLFDQAETTAILAGDPFARQIMDGVKATCGQLAAIVFIKGRLEAVE